MRDGGTRPLRSDADRIVLALAAGLIFVATVLLLLPGGPAHRAFATSLDETDFKAFYCAARVMRERENPYLAAPLEHCQEYDAAPPGRVPGSVKVIDAAPQPSYDFVLFAPISFPAFYTAAVLWAAFLALCLLLSSWLLARMAGVPLFVVIVAFSIIEGYRSISYGQIPPIVIAALCLSAYCLQRGRGSLAGIAAAFSMIEPNIGLAACLGLFVWQPRSRLALIGMGVVFACLGLAAVGVAGNVMYFSQVLPVHQLSELGEPIQYSLTWLLHELNVPPRAALTAGSISYALLLVLSIAIVPGLTRAFDSKVPVVLFPPAAVMLGGPFVHLFEIGAALPFAIFAAGRAPAHRRLAWIAIALLALDWPATKFLRLNVLEGVVMVTLIAYLTRERALAVRAGLVLAAFCAYAFFALAVHVLPSASLERPAAAQAIDATRYDPRLASTQVFFIRRDERWQLSSLQTVAAKIPTWIGLSLIVTLALLLAFEPPRYDTRRSPVRRRARA